MENIKHKMKFDCINFNWMVIWVVDNTQEDKIILITLILIMVRFYLNWIYLCKKVNN